jgi:predicted  nucleic acid-binding Zn-ribbon protein
MIEEEFNLRLATVEETLKYLGDSTEKWEWYRKKAEVDSRKTREEYEKRMDEHEKRMDEINKNLDYVSRHLKHITKIIKLKVEEDEFQEEKLVEAGKLLSKKRA